MADVATASLPRASETAWDSSRVLILSALIIAAAVAPLLPPIAWKVKATQLAAVLVAAGFYMRVQREASVGRSSLDRPALILLAAAVLSTLFSVEPLVSFFPSRFRGEGLIVFVPFLILALAAARLTRHDMESVLTATVAAGAAVALIALPQYYGLDSLQALGFRSAPPLVLTGPIPAELRVESWMGLRAYGTLANPIFLGAYAALVLPLAAALTLQARGPAAWAYGAAALLLYGALVASQTRAAWVGVAAGAVVLLRMMPKPPGALRRAALLAAGLAAVTVLLVLTRPDVSLLRRASETFGANDYSMRQKLYTWKHTLPLIAQRPLLGWGFSTLVGQFKDMGSPEYLRVFGDREIVLIDSPHNELLHVAYSVGLIGLAAYLWMWRAGITGLARRPPASSAMCAGLAASLFGYAIWLQFGWNVIGPANVFWVLLGLAAGQARGASTESADRCTVKVAGSRPTDSPSA